MGDMRMWPGPGNPQELTFQDYQLQDGSNPDHDYMNPIQQSPITSFDRYQNYASPKIIYQNIDNNLEDEIPLLEELEIEPDKIIKRMLLILNPSGSCVILEEYDLVGPLIFCILLPSILLLSAKTYFSQVVGFGALCSFFMYCLLRLMSPQPVAPNNVISVLGYGLLPQILLAIIGIVMPLYSMVGFLLAFVCILWSSFATSRIFSISMNMNAADSNQSLLIAYPCALLYSVFTLLVLF